MDARAINEYTHIRACARRPMLAELTPGWQRCPGLPAPGDMSQAGTPAHLARTGVCGAITVLVLSETAGLSRAIPSSLRSPGRCPVLEDSSPHCPKRWALLGLREAPAWSAGLARLAVLCPNLRSWVARRSLLFCHRYVPCLTGCSRFCSSWLVAVLDWPPAPISESFWGSTPPSSALT